MHIVPNIVCIWAFPLAEMGTSRVLNTLEIIQPILYGDLEMLRQEASRSEGPFAFMHASGDLAQVKARASEAEKKLNDIDSKVRAGQQLTIDVIRSDTVRR